MRGSEAHQVSLGMRVVRGEKAIPGALVPQGREATLEATAFRGIPASQEPQGRPETRGMQVRGDREEKRVLQALVGQRVRPARLGRR